MLGKKTAWSALWAPLALVLCSGPAWAGCDTGQNLYLQALEIAAPAPRAAMLRASIAACPSGLAWIELGRTHLAQGQLAQAESAFRESLKWTGLPGERATALAWLGRAQQAMGHREEARESFQASLKLRHDPKVAALAEGLAAEPPPRP